MGYLRFTLICLEVFIFVGCQSLTVTNCNNQGDDIFLLKNVDVQPYPIPIPGKVNISVSGTLTRPINESIQVDVTVWKNIVDWIELPCVNNMGSCTYRDACSFLKDINSQGCRRFLKDNNIPCSCPIPPGTYSVPHLEADISSLLPAGEYRLKVRLTEKTTPNKQIACYTVNFEMKNASPSVISRIGQFFTSLFGG